MDAAGQAVQDIALSHIQPGDNDRTHFDEASLGELADSIAAHGLAQPVTLRPVDGPTPYQIVAGERRFRALQLLQARDATRTTIRAIVQVMTDQQADAVMLAENVQRKDLNPMDEARAYQKRMDKYGWTAGQVADMAKVSVHRVRARLALLNLLPEVQTLVQFGHIELGKAEAMGTLDHNHQAIAFRALRGRPMRNEEFTRIVANLRAQQDQLALFDLSLFATLSDAEVAAQLTVTPVKTTALPVALNGATLWLVIEHPSDTVLVVDTTAIAAAVTLEKRG